MHNVFIFPIDCHSPQIPLTEPEVIQTEKGLYIRDKGLNLEKSYEVFKKIEIIPSLIKTVERIKKKGEKEEDLVDPIMDFLKEWGYLKIPNPGGYTEIRSKGRLVRIKLNGRKTKARMVSVSNKPPNNFLGQKISIFVREATKFYDYWMLYQAIANRDLEKLKKLITVKEDPSLPFAATHTFTFFDGGYTDSIFYEDNPLGSYQSAAMTYLTEGIGEYINNHELYSKEIRYSPSQDEDAFKLKPAMGFLDLLDALYMQFFILLNENEKKICPICNTPFIPTRKDKKYCTDSCKLTAKSRRYRARKRKII